MPLQSVQDEPLTLHCVNKHDLFGVEGGTTMRRIKQPIGLAIYETAPQTCMLVQAFSCNVCGYVELYSVGPVANSGTPDGVEEP